MIEDVINVGFRRLDPDHDVECFRQAYGWDRGTPQWYREMDSIFGDYAFDEYIVKAKQATQINIGLFEAEEMFAMITTNLISSGVYDLHLAAARHASVEKIIRAFISIRRQMFEDLNALVLYGWVACVNRPLMRLALRLGFKPDGLKMFKGSVKGKVVKWMRVIYTRRNYEQEKTGNDAIKYESISEHKHLWLAEHAVNT